MMNTVTSMGFPPVCGQGVIMPTLALRSHVKYFWYYHPDLMHRPSSEFRIIPSGCPGLIFQQNNGYSSVRQLNGDYYPVVFLHGQDTKPCVNIAGSNAPMISVRLYPASLKTLFGIDADEIRDTAIPIDDLAGFNLTEQLLNAPDILCAIKLLEDFLLEKAENSKYDGVFINKVISYIMDSLSSISSGELATCFHVTQRDLQRKFKEFIGVPPQTYIHVLKFQKAVNLIQRNQYRKLSDVAYRLGYADQSHFIRNFKLFYGDTPKEASKTLSQPEHAAPHILQNRIKLIRFIYN